MTAEVRLAGQLIEARCSIKQSQRGLAVLANLDVSTINRIESAERMPSALHLMKLLNAFLEEGLKLDEALWVKIAKDATGCTVTFRPDGHASVRSPAEVPLVRNARGHITLNETTFMALKTAAAFSVVGMPSPRGVKTKGDLCEAMKQMWRESGYRSTREMAALVEEYHRYFKGDADKRVLPLSKSTFGAMRKGVLSDEDPVFPAKLNNFKAFVVACGLQDKLKPWVAAWHRAEAAPEETS